MARAAIFLVIFPLPLLFAYLRLRRAGDEEESQGAATRSLLAAASNARLVIAGVLVLAAIVSGSAPILALALILFSLFVLLRRRERN